MSLLLLFNGQANPLSGVVGTSQVGSLITTNFPLKTANAVIVGIGGQTNLIRNPRAEGAKVGVGAAGIPPTNWSIGLNAGVSSDIVATGVDAGTGYSYVDIRIYGSQTVQGGSVRFESPTFIDCNPSDTFSQSFYAALVGGTTANVINFGIGLWATDVNGAVVQAGPGGLGVAIPPASLTGTLQRFFNPAYTLASTSTIANVWPMFTLSITLSAAINFTIRLAAPQLEIGVQCTPVTLPPIGAPQLSARGVYPVALFGAAAQTTIQAVQGQTNLIRNPRPEGAVVGIFGSGGVFPTYWATVIAGTTLTIVALGTDGATGLPYIDVRIAGTVSSGQGRLTFDAFVKGITCNPGDPFAASMYVALVAGSYTNVNTFGIGLFVADVNGTVLVNPGQGSIMALTATLQRFIAPPQTITTNASTYNVIPAIQFFWNVSTAVDFTIRIACPQLEYGAITTAASLPPPGQLHPSDTMLSGNGQVFTNPVLIAGVQGQTNLLLNPRGEGAIVGGGVIPTYWVQTPHAGVSLIVVGTGTDATTGLPYVDLHLFGTSASTGMQLRFETTFQIAFNPNDPFAFSVYLALVGGTTAGGVTFAQWVYSLGPDGIQVGSPVNTGLLTLTATPQRFVFLNTASPSPTTTYILPLLLFNWTNGVAVDFTTRIICPQFEYGYQASPPSLPTPGQLKPTDTMLAANAQVFTTPVGIDGLGGITNFVPNPNAEGAVVGTIGSGGAWPTGWAWVTTLALTAQIIATGTSDPDLGLPYVDVRISGTPNATGASLIRLSPTNVIATISNDVWSQSVHAALVGGSNTNVANFGQVIYCFASNGTTGATNTAAATFAPTGTLQRFPVPNRLIPVAATARFGCPTIWISMTINLAVDFTLRIACTQLENSPAVTPLILPPLGTPAVTTRGLQANPVVGNFATILGSATITANAIRLAYSTSTVLGSPTIITATPTLRLPVSSVIAGGEGNRLPSQTPSANPPNTCVVSTDIAPPAGVFTPVYKHTANDATFNGVLSTVSTPLIPHTCYVWVWVPAGWAGTLIRFSAELNLVATTSDVNLSLTNQWQLVSLGTNAPTAGNFNFVCRTTDPTATPYYTAGWRAVPDTVVAVPTPFLAASATVLGSPTIITANAIRLAYGTSTVLGSPTIITVTPTASLAASATVLGSPTIITANAIRLAYGIATVLGSPTIITATPTARLPASTTIATGGKTNYVHNPRGEGALVGTPGTFPTGWSTGSVPAQLAQQIVTTGIDAATGFAYVDIRFSGTTIGAGSFYIFVDPNTLFCGPGDVFSNTAWLALSGGSLTNVSALYYISNFSPSGQIITSITALINATLSQYGTNATAPAGTTSISLTAFVQYTYAAGPIDITIRIGPCQLERGSRTGLILPPVGTPGISTRAVEAYPIPLVNPNTFVGVAGLGLAGLSRFENLLTTTQGSVSRASTATYLDANGVMQLAPINVARIDHDPTPPYRSFDVLLEPSSTNLILNANNTSPAYVSVSSTDIPPLYVGAKVWKATSIGTNGNFGAYVSIAVSTYAIYTASIWVYIPAGYAGGQPRCDADFAAEIGATPDGSFHNVADLSKTNQWQRIIQSASCPGPTMNIVMRMNTTDVSGQFFYHTCWQVEPGLVATSYIPTSGTAVTRAADLGSFSRDTPATYLDYSGTMQTAAANVLRFNYDTSGNVLGPLIEGKATNYVRNPFALGSVVGAIGSGGVLPTFWLQANPHGVWSIVGTGNTLGIPTIRLRCQGTSVSTQNTALYFEYGAGIDSVGYSTTVSHSFWLALVAGSFTNLSLITHFMPCFPATGAAVLDVRPNFLPSITSTLTQFSMLSTTPSSGAGPFHYPNHALLFFPTGTGVVFDFTIDIGAPQIELAPTSSAIYPAIGTTGQSTRAADYGGDLLVLDLAGTVTQGPALIGVGCTGLVGSVSEQNLQTVSSVSAAGQIGTFKAKNAELIIGVTANAIAGNQAPLDLNLLSTLDGHVVFARNSIGTYFDATGTLQTAPINTPRFDYDPVSGNPLGLWFEEPRTNSIPNATMVGAVTGNPGTMPNNWGARALVSGVTSSIDGLGVENGINYIDVRFTGTPSSLAQIYFALGPAITASSGQVWTASIYLRLIAGSMTNTQTLGIQLNEIPNNTLDRASVVPTTAPLNTQRSGVTATLQATTTSIIPYFVFQGTSTSLAFDFTIRVGAPQVELGAYRTSFIPTSGTTVARAGDSAYLLCDPSWCFNASAGTLCFEYDTTNTGTGLQIEGGLNSNSGTNNLLYLHNSYLAVSVNGVGSQPTSSGTTSLTGVINRQACTYANGLIQNSGNGAVTTSAAATGPFLWTYRLTFGCSPWVLDNQIGGHMRRVQYWPYAFASTDLSYLTANILAIGDQVTKPITGVAGLGQVGSLTNTAQYGVVTGVATIGTAANQAPLDFNLLNSLDNRIVFARNSIGTYFDATLTMQTAPINTPRFDYDPVSGNPLGLWIEKGATNYITNSTMVGAVVGTPGTLPTTWNGSTAIGAGLTSSVVGFGVEDGIPYIDVRYNGTPTAAGQSYFSVGNGITAGAGNVWTGSFYLRVMAGSLSNVNQVGFQINDNPALGSFRNTFSPTTAPLKTQRAVTTTPALLTGTTNIVPYFLFTVATASVAIDFTMRIGAPQCELGAYATSFIPTTTASVTRIIDTAYLLCNSSWLFNANAGTIAYEFDTNESTFVVGGFSDGTFSNTYYFTATTISAIIATVGNSTPSSGAPLIGGAINYRAGTYASGQVLNSSNGSVPTSAVTGTAPFPWTQRLTIGSSPWNLDSQIGGHMRRVRYWPSAFASYDLSNLTTNVLAIGDQISKTSLGVGGFGQAGSFKTNFILPTSVAIAGQGGQTNWIANPNAEGIIVGTINSGGAWPTNWLLGNLGGITAQVIAYNYDPTTGYAYIDFRLFGSPTVNSNTLRFDPGNDIPTNLNDIWSYSMYVALVGGSLVAGQTFSQTVYINDASLASVGNLGGGGFTPTATLQRFTNPNKTVTFPTARYAWPTLLFTYSVGVALDFTLRIAAPQLERGTVVTPAILPPFGAPGVTTRPMLGMPVARLPAISQIIGADRMPVFDSTTINDLGWQTFLSNGNRTITRGPGDPKAGNFIDVDGAKGEVSVTAGKFYAEFTPLPSGTWSQSCGFGIANAQSVYSQLINDATNGSLLFPFYGVWTNGSPSSVLNGNTWVTETAAMAVDFDNERIWFRLLPSGQWNGSPSADPSLPATGIDISSLSALPLAVVVSMGDVLTGGTINMGSVAFLGTVPTGFNAWPIIPGGGHVNATAKFVAATNASIAGSPTLVTATPTLRAAANTSIAGGATIIATTIANKVATGNSGIGQVGSLINTLQGIVVTGTSGVGQFGSLFNTTQSVTLIAAYAYGSCGFVDFVQRKTAIISGVSTTGQRGSLTTQNVEPAAATIGGLGNISATAKIGTPASAVIAGQSGTTNYVRNPRCEGAVVGTPGTLPTFWSETINAPGLSRQVVGSGIDPATGLPYVDLRYFGTTTGSGLVIVYIELNMYSIAAIGDPFVATGWLGLVAGSTTALPLAVYSANIVGSAIQVIITAPSLSLGFRQYTGTVTATTSGTFGNLFAQFVISAGTVDFTVRFGGFQLERGTVATPLIFPPPGSPAVTTRALLAIPGVAMPALAEIDTVTAVQASTWVAAKAVAQFNGVGGTTNYVRNPRAEGAIVGTPGTLPTFWTEVIYGDASRQVVGTGIDAATGLSYVDIRYFGPGVAAGEIDLWIEPDVLRTIAPGDAFGTTAWIGMPAGSRTNISSVYYALFFTNSTQQSSVSPLATAALVPIGSTKTAGVSDTAIRGPLIIIGVPGRGPFDITLRLAGFQLECNIQTPLILPPVGAPAVTTRAVYATGVSIAQTTAEIDGAGNFLVVTVGTTPATATISGAANVQARATAQLIANANITDTDTLPTWDPASVLFPATTILSNNNLTITSNGTPTFDGAMGTVGATSGKFYAEFTPGSAWSPNSLFGIANKNATYTGLKNDGTNGCVLQPYGSGLWLNGGATGVSINWTTETLAVAVDLTNKRIWFRAGPSGLWNGSASGDPTKPSTGLSIATLPAPLYPVVELTNSCFGTINMGASAFAGVVPTGYSGWPTTPGGGHVTATAITIEPATATINGTGSVAADGQRIVFAKTQIAGQGGTTNYIRNPRAEGAVVGTPGTLPTFWSDPGVPAQLTRQIVATGTDAATGLTYVDVRYFGTLSSLANFYLTIEPTYGSATSGDTFTMTLWAALLVGSPSVIQLQAFFAGGSSFSKTLTSVINATLAPLSATSTAAAGTTGVGSMQVLFLIVTGPVDFTLRIAASQLERSAVATPVILPPVGAPGVTTRGVSASATNLATTVAQISVLGSVTATVPSQRMVANAVIAGQGGGATNYIRNPRLEGAVIGTPGTRPTFWQVGGDTVAMSLDVVGIGVEDGLSYVDIRWHGLPTASGSSWITPEGLSTTAPQTQPGIVSTLSAYIRISGGSLTNISQCLLSLQNRDSTAGYLGQLNNIFTPISTATLGTQRFAISLTASAVTAYATPVIYVYTTTAGVAVDLTLRIAGLQQEWGSQPTPLILPPPGTLTAWTDGIEAQPFVLTTPHLIGVSSLARPGALIVQSTVATTGITAVSQIGFVAFLGQQGSVAVGVSTTGQPGLVAIQSTKVIASVAAVGKLGTITAPFVEPLIGLSGTAQCGSVTFTLQETLTSVVATAKLGTVKQQIITGDTSGNSSVGQAGEVLVTGLSRLVLAGVATPGQAGSISVRVDDVGTALGVVGTAHFGLAKQDPTAPLIGQSSTGQAGSISLSTVTPISAASGAGQYGNVISALTKAINGVSAVGHFGDVQTAAQQVGVAIGVGGTAQLGSLVVHHDSAMAIAGVATTNKVGVVTIRSGTEFTVTGIGVVAQIGTASGQITKVATGVTGVGQVGLGVDQVSAVVGHLQFINETFTQGVLPAGWTLTRASTATDNTYHGGTAFTTYLADQPRLSAAGILIEQNSTNLFLHSETPQTQTITLLVVTGSASGSSFTAWMVGSGTVALTSGTALIGGQFPLWDPVTVTQSDTVLSNGNRTIIRSNSGLAVADGAKSNLSGTRGKFYAEFTPNNKWSSLDAFGIANLNSDYTSLNQDATNGCILFPHYGVWCNGSDAGLLLNAWTTQTVAMAVDLDNACIWFRVLGGFWNGDSTSDPTIASTGLDISSVAISPLETAVTMAVANGQGGTVNMGTDPFLGTVPAGYSGWAPKVASAGVPVPFNISGGVTNYIQNPRAEGASLGPVIAPTEAVLPTNWHVWGTVSSIDVVGMGVEDGLSYIDLHVYGTPNNPLWGVNFSQPQFEIPTRSGDVWTQSLYFTVKSGDTAGFKWRLEHQYLDGGGQFVTSTLGTDNAIFPTGSLGASRKSLTATVPPNYPTIAYNYPTFFMEWPVGQPVDLVLRLAGPQCEIGAVMNALVLPPPGTLAATIQGTITATISGAVDRVQIEPAFYPSSYIPTGAVAATRAEDRLAKVYLDGVLNTVESTYWVDWYAPDATTSGGALVTAGTGAYTVAAIIDSLVQSNYTHLSSGTTTLIRGNTQGTAVPVFNSFSPDPVTRCVFAVNSTTLRIAANNVLRSAPVTPISRPALTTITLGNGAITDRPSNAISGYIRGFRYWPFALTDTQLLTVSDPTLSDADILALTDAQSVVHVVATGQVGSVATKVDDQQALTGAVAAGQAGSTAPQIDQTRAIIGTLATSQVGEITIRAGSDIPLSGIATIGQAGLAFITVDDEGDIAGTIASGNAGSLVTATSDTASPNGVFVYGMVGTTRDIDIVAASDTTIMATGHVGSMSITTVADDGSVATITPQSVSAYGQVGSFAFQIDLINTTPAGVAAHGVTGVATPNVGYPVAATVAIGYAGSITIKDTSTVAPRGVGAIGIANALPRTTLLKGISSHGSCGPQVISVGHVINGQVSSGAAGTMNMRGAPITGRSGVGKVGNIARLFDVAVSVSGTATHGTAGAVRTAAVVHKKIPAYVMVY